MKLTLVAFIVTALALGSIWLTTPMPHHISGNANPWMALAWLYWGFLLVGFFSGLRYMLCRQPTGRRVQLLALCAVVGLAIATGSAFLLRSAIPSMTSLFVGHRTEDLAVRWLAEFQLRDVFMMNQYLMRPVYTHPWFITGSLAASLAAAAGLLILTGIYARYTSHGRGQSLIAWRRCLYSGLILVPLFCFMIYQNSPGPTTLWPGRHVTVFIVGYWLASLSLAYGLVGPTSALDATRRLLALRLWGVAAGIAAVSCLSYFGYKLAATVPLRFSDRVLERYPELTHISFIQVLSHHRYLVLHMYQNVWFIVGSLSLSMLIVAVVLCIKHQRVTCDSDTA